MSSNGHAQPPANELHDEWQTALRELQRDARALYEVQCRLAITEHRLRLAERSNRLLLIACGLLIVVAVGLLLVNGR